MKMKGEGGKEGDKRGGGAGRERYIHKHRDRERQKRNLWLRNRTNNTLGHHSLKQKEFSGKPTAKIW